MFAAIAESIFLGESKGCLTIFIHDGRIDLQKSELEAHFVKIDGFLSGAGKAVKLGCCCVQHDKGRATRAPKDCGSVEQEYIPNRLVTIWYRISEGDVSVAVDCVWEVSACAVLSASSQGDVFTTFEVQKKFFGHHEMSRIWTKHTFAKNGYCPRYFW